MSLSVVFEILPGVVEPDAALLQEAIEFVARLKPEKPAELSGRELVFAVLFESNGFKGGAREIGTSRGEGGGEFVWEVEGHLHGCSIAEAKGRMREKTSATRFKDTIPKPSA